jgi:NADH dehydrogenase
VEIASELHALAHKTLAPDYPNIDPNRVRIILVDSNEEILKELDPALRRAARRHLEELEIEVINEVRAKEVTANCVILDDDREIEAEKRRLDRRQPRERQGGGPGPPAAGREGRRDGPLHAGARSRERVGDRRLRGKRGQGREPVPPNAQAAVQEGEALAKNILATIDGEELTPFEYKPMGQLVELGSQFAVTISWA